MFKPAILKRNTRFAWQAFYPDSEVFQKGDDDEYEYEDDFNEDLNPKPTIASTTFGRLRPRIRREGTAKSEARDPQHATHNP